MQSWEESEKEHVRECAVSHQAAGLAPGFVKRPETSLSCLSSSFLIGSVSQEHQREGTKQVAVRRGLRFPFPSASRQSPLLILAASTFSQQQFISSDFTDQGS